MIPELVLTVCMHTALACEAIDVSFKHLRPLRSQTTSSYVKTKVQARAYMTNFGNQGIWFDPEETSNMNDNELLNLVVHELAHLMVFVEDLDGTHRWKWKTKCKDLAKKVGANTGIACAARH